MGFSWEGVAWEGGKGIGLARIVCNLTVNKINSLVNWFQLNLLLLYIQVYKQTIISNAS